MSFLECVSWLVVASAVVIVALKAVAPRLTIVENWKPSMLLVCVGVACSAAGHLIVLYGQFVAYRAIFLFAPIVFLALAIYQMRKERKMARQVAIPRLRSG